MLEMEIDYGMSVADKNGKSIGTVDHIVLDSWSGEPRKFVVRLEDEVSAVYFSPEQVAEVTKDKVSLNLAFEEMEQT
jgi:sporulation protein YlmC with PRC-barrel domain